ncbi:NACHT domain-containing protein [Microcoleus vaginatus]|uniref:NACHT domain-containing protein n=1 Tax=Microcoleus vaginatus TaxID=119532 RepID=UPI0016826DBC|nr:NACHT domain-containing NTPase [Microcoleus sp. FACHB-84]MBD2009132.1 NACHT domain-containing NTPase [Microcoleus sp. FACHB-45]
MTTLKTSEEGLVKIRQARRERGWTIEDPRWLVEASKALDPDRTWTEAGPYADGLSLPTWRRFLAGREPIKANAFKAFCTVLQLNWEEIVDRPPLASPYQGGVGGVRDFCQQPIDSVVQEIRQKCHSKIQQLYSKMQLLDIAQPVDVSNLYVEVNILEEITSWQPGEIRDLLRDFNPDADNFNRLGLGKVRQKRVSGLDAVKSHSKLMVLGKPGSGKTTFLKHIAIQCDRAKFEANKIPIFISLKTFAEIANVDLLEYISDEFASCGVEARSQTEFALSQGRGLILLDGLDEVPESNSDAVVRQIRQFVQKYYNNQFIITCRIAASKYRFHEEGFTNVEVADFNNKQIAAFAINWFVAFSENIAAGKALASQFLEKLKLQKNQQIRELAVTPILLNLTCLVFQAKTDFPSNRANLYEEGLEILLRKWDETRGIQRDEVYRNLNFSHKQHLLAFVAAITFERGDYFFEKNTVQQLIADYLANLPYGTTDPVQLESQSEVVLKAIEAQHGLLVERARGIYSFSHLTFQEYFKAKQIVNNSDPQSWKKLVSHLTEKRWREVLFLAVGMWQKADDLLLLMKQQVDGLVADDEQLQQFLMWVRNKSFSIKAPYKASAIRAFYLGREVERVSNPCSNLNFDLNLIRILAYAIDHTFKPPLELFFLDFTSYYDNKRDSALATERHSDLATDIVLDVAMFYAIDLNIPYTYAAASGRNLLSILAFTLNLNLEPELKQSLQQLRHQLYDSAYTNRIQEWWRSEREWWNAKGQDWTQQLINVMIKYRNIGHDWQFSQEQKSLLRKYYDANKLLVDCLNSGCNVSPAVRQEIEETLLLPIAHLQKTGDKCDRPL